MQRAISETAGKVRPGTRAGWRRGALGRLGDAVNALIGPTERDSQRQDVVRRAVLAAGIIAVLPIQQLRLPGWEAVLAGCIAAILYDGLLAYLVFVKERIFTARVLGVVLDALVLMGASMYVFRQMGAANATSDIWLVFLVYIVVGGFTLTPLGSLLYTATWVGWLALATLLFFEPGSVYYGQLPLRVVFSALIGFTVLATSQELERRRMKLEQQNRQTMGMLATLVEARDTDAGAHLHHIQHFSRALALHVGVSPREAQEIAYASMIHDVGKAHVPDAILKKSGPLDPEEWRIMQLHTVWGENLLVENQDFAMAQQVARWHHEHWDGSGYPDGLKGEAIPLAARIVAVADVYDALISSRPYKDAWPPEAALQELRSLAGTHLDPEIVQAFAGLAEKGVIDLIIQQITREGVRQEAPLPHVA
ncbi:MAG: HD domain-containing protein [Chloroflexi bacterium]|nr:HD domain-containing protein [Chloroflexota bacterium]